MSNVTKIAPIVQSCSNTSKLLIDGIQLFVWNHIKLGLLGVTPKLLSLACTFDAEKLQVCHFERDFAVECDS